MNKDKELNLYYKVDHRTNHYYCIDCRIEWKSEGISDCIDQCPKCNKVIQPFESEPREVKYYERDNNRRNE